MYLVYVALVAQLAFGVVKSNPLEAGQNRKVLTGLQFPDETSLAELGNMADLVGTNLLDFEHEEQELPEIAELFEETVHPPIHQNVTLNTISDTQLWTISRTTLPKWFEYYNDTKDLNSSASNIAKCARVISSSVSNLSNVDGIWVACQDPENPDQCHSSSSVPCHPYLKYTQILGGLAFRTVKIHLSLHGLGIVRLIIGVQSNRDPDPVVPACFDFSHRMDPFSSCEFVKVIEASDKFAIVHSQYNGYTNKEFNTFSIQLIARFKNDVALVDKVEATGLLLCGEGECTTAKPGPTRTEPDTTRPSTQSTKCQVISARETSLKTVQADPPPVTLNVDEDAESDSNWKLSSLNPQNFEYYSDFDSVWDQTSNSTESCANIIPKDNITDLEQIQGLWISCQASEHIVSQKEIDLADPPFVLYASSTMFLKSINVDFYLIGNASVRLHVGTKCYDHTYINISDSPCEFTRVRDDGVYWRGLFWQNKENDQEATEFKVELISSAVGDVVLLDKVSSQYQFCDNGDCLQTTTEVSNTGTYTTDLSTTDNDCELTSTTPVSVTTPQTATTERDNVTETSTTPVSTTNSQTPTTKRGNATGTTKIPCTTTEKPNTSPLPSSAKSIPLSQKLLVAATAAILIFRK